MYKSSQLIRQQGEPSFVKGMTLNEYMSKNMVEGEAGAEDGQIEQEQNLYESSGNKKVGGMRAKKTQYLIDEIDQQSIQDSIENYFNEQNIIPHKNEKTKQTLVQNTQANENPWRARINSISMNATAFFKTSNQQKNTFRIKHMSISPYKKKMQTTIETGSITLYGSKFGQTLNKNATKIPELVTFYGKLNHHEDPHKRDTFNGFKKKQSKRNFQKKNQLQIDQLIEFQSKIKNNYSHKNYLQQFKVEGVKDKFSQRKNKFC